MQRRVYNFSLFIVFLIYEVTFYEVMFNIKLLKMTSNKLRYNSSKTQKARIYLKFK